MLPNILTGPDVIVPHTEIQHLLSIPDEDLSLHGVLEDLLQTQYTLKDPLKPWYANIQSCVLRNFYTVHVPAIRYLEKLMTTNIDKMMDEVGQGLTQYLGEDCQAWRNVTPFDVMEKVTARVGNMFVVGRPLCEFERNLSLPCPSECTLKSCECRVDDLKD